MTTHVNKGLQVSGHGSIQATNLAGGENAKAVMQTEGADPAKQQLLTEILQKVGELEKAIQQQPALPNRQMVAESTATLKAELAKEKPNRLTVSAVLEGIAGAVKSVTGIAGSVEGLKTIIDRLF